jgi:hypothetical protein
MVTGLKLNKYNGNLVVSTYGRGIWKTILPGYPVTLPYRIGFEDDLDYIWEFTSSTSYGRIQQTTYNSPLRRFPYCGTKHLTMDVSENGHYTTNEALMNVNLENEDTVFLSFWWKEFNDETHYTLDGIYLSDDLGDSFVQVDSLYNNDGSWVFFELDLTELASENNLELNDSFLVKFQHYDNDTIELDGFAFDEVVVRGPSPDIILRRQFVSPTYLDAGDPIYVHGTVKNDSDYPADSSLLNFYLSEDNDYDYDTDVQIGQAEIPALDPDESYTYYDTLQTTPSKSRQSKSYEEWYIGFFADASNHIIEEDELNNERYIRIYIDWGEKAEEDSKEDSDTTISKKKLLIDDPQVYSGTEDLKIFPNPVENSIRVAFAFGEYRGLNVSIRDIRGNTIKTINNIDQPVVDIDVSNFSEGMYFIEITGSKKYQGRFIIK